MTEIPRHPAKFTPAILEVIGPILRKEAYILRRPIDVLDPFAGVGGIHKLGGPMVRTVGIELEPEWAAAHPQTLVGDALDLASHWNEPTFDVICTSCTYGNRMADNHDAKDSSRRNTYKHSLGRDPSPGSSAVMQWGQAYWDFHRAAWVEATRVLLADGLFILNVKDHIRGKQIIPVSEWHLGVLTLLGFRLVRAIRVPVTGNRQGENGDARVPYENVYVLRSKQ